MDLIICKNNQGIHYHTTVLRSSIFFSFSYFHANSQLLQCKIHIQNLKAINSSENARTVVSNRIEQNLIETSDVRHQALH